jgi:hypothetical protein
MSQAASTETVTQYGIKLPNGDTAWAKDAEAKYLGVNIVDAATNRKTINPKDGRNGYGRLVMEDAMACKAADANIDPIGYIKAHSYVCRDIITITMEPVPVVVAEKADNYANVPF